MMDVVTFSGGINGVPQYEDRQRMWRELVIDDVTTPCEALDTYLSALRDVYVNGSVRFGSYRIGEHLVFDWYASRNQFYELRFFESFWLHPTLHNLMPEDLLDLTVPQQDIFKWSSPFLLAGSLAWGLAAGGAYKRHAKGPLDAIRMADSFAAHLIHGDYDNILVFQSHTAWSKYFFDVVWDHTVVIVDKPKRLLHVIAATDTD